VKIIGFYDTYQGPAGNGYEGCWGVYPYLPSGNIIASDVNEGLFVLKLNYIVGIQEKAVEKIKLFPNPVISGNEVSFDKQVTFEIYTLSGKSLFGKQEGNKFSTSNMITGCYFIKINNTFTKLIVK
jgi:hypothetical protein